MSAQIIDPASEPAITQAEKLRLIRDKIKYVFVLFQENRSFDFYFGSYPGADGLYAGPDGPYHYRPGARIHATAGEYRWKPGSDFALSGFRRRLTDAKGKTVPLYPADIASVNHSHTAIARKIALDANGVAQNSEYALTEEGVTMKDGMPSKAPTLERKQFGELVMAHVDCDTAPFLWRYADRFTLFDHFMDTIIGPSTPNAIAMISGQGGETQWMLHPDAGGGGRPRQGRGCADGCRPRALLGIGAGHCGQAQSAASGETGEKHFEEPDLRQPAALLHGQTRSRRPRLRISIPHSICPMCSRTLIKLQGTA